MTGPLVLGIAGAALVLLALVRSAALRPHISDRVTTYPGTSDSPGLRELATYVRTQGNLTRLAALGSALQLVALLWQAAS